MNIIKETKKAFIEANEHIELEDIDKCFKLLEKYKIRPNSGVLDELTEADFVPQSLSCLVYIYIREVVNADLERKKFKSKFGIICFDKDNIKFVIDDSARMRQEVEEKNYHRLLNLTDVTKQLLKEFDIIDLTDLSY